MLKFLAALVHSVWALVQSPVRDLLTAEVAVRDRQELRGLTTWLYVEGRLVAGHWRAQDENQGEYNVTVAPGLDRQILRLEPAAALSTPQKGR